MAPARDNARTQEYCYLRARVGSARPSCNIPAFYEIELLHWCLQNCHNVLCTSVGGPSQLKKISRMVKGLPCAFNHVLRAILQYLIRDADNDYLNHAGDAETVDIASDEQVVTDGRGASELTPGENILPSHHDINGHILFSPLPASS